MDFKPIGCVFCIKKPEKVRVFLCLTIAGITNTKQLPLIDFNNTIHTTASKY